MYDDNFLNFLKSSKLILYILDDNAPLGEEGIGQAQVDLKPLIANQPIDSAVEIKGSKNQKIG